LPKAELGAKRTCPVTGKKFYDLGRDPIVSPYTGQSYPRTYFDPQPKIAKVEAEDDEIEVDAATTPDMVSLEEADTADDAKAAPDDDIDIEDDDDTFLEQEEDEDDSDVSDLIDGDIEEDEEG